MESKEETLDARSGWIKKNKTETNTWITRPVATNGDANDHETNREYNSIHKRTQARRKYNSITDDTLNTHFK